MTNGNRSFTNRPQKFKEVAPLLKASPWLVLEIKTTGTNPEKDVITDWFISSPALPEIIQIATNDQPSAHTNEVILRLLEGVPIVVYDWATIRGFLRQIGDLSSFRVKSDVLVEAYITGRFPSSGLRDLVQDMYGEELTDGVSEDGLDLENLSGVQSQLFCARTSHIKQIHNDLYPDIFADPDLRRLHEIEMAVLPIADEMSEVGIRVDSNRCKAEHARLMNEAEELSKSFHGWLSRNFSITEHFDFNSSAQTAELLIDRLQIIQEVKTQKGNRSTSKKIFEGLRDTSPIVNALYSYRELIKSATGFYGLYPQFEGQDARMHPKLLTCHVISGRTASADPNIQQIPKGSIWRFVDFDDQASDVCASCKSEYCPSCERVKHKELQTAVREVFVPRDGYMFVEGDYSQIELMVLAGVSKEPKMLRAFRDGIDIHSQTAALIYSVPLDKVTKEQRQTGKTTNFRFNYGGGPGGLATQLGIPLTQAMDINNAYSRAYPMVEAFASKSAREAAIRGYIETLFGRRRHMPEFSATDAKTRARGRRLAVNLQIQGGAADIAKIGLVRQDEARREFNQERACKTYLVNFVHDSYLWEVPIVSGEPNRQAEFIRGFIQSMKRALCFQVAKLTGLRDFPELKVDFKVGSNYQDMVDFAKSREISNCGRQ